MHFIFPNLYDKPFVGSYTDSPGIEIIRKHVAQYIERRDGIPSDYLNVLLCAGASDGIKVNTFKNTYILYKFCNSIILLYFYLFIHQ